MSPNAYFIGSGSSSSKCSVQEFNKYMKGGFMSFMFIMYIFRFYDFKPESYKYIDTLFP